MTSPPVTEQGPSVVHHILLVDDDRSVAITLKAVLEDEGLRVSVAHDGGQAHAAFAVRKPDLVLLDLLLPGESGFEVCEHMKIKDETVPVVILTAVDMDEARELARRVGADAYFVKPIDPQQLIEDIQTTAQRVWERHRVGRSHGDGSRIHFQCPCGKRFKVSTSHRGKQMTCPQCGEPILVPRHA